MMFSVDIKLDAGAKMPVKRLEKDIGFVLFSTDAFTLEAMNISRFTRHTGVHINIPDGYCGIIRALPEYSASGIQCEGIINPCSPDEVIVYMFNRSGQRIHFDKGQEIAQFVIVPVPDIVLREAE